METCKRRQWTAMEYKKKGSEGAEKLRKSPWIQPLMTEELGWGKVGRREKSGRTETGGQRGEKI